MREALEPLVPALDDHVQKEIRKIWPWAADSLAARDASETEREAIQVALDQAEGAIVSAGSHLLALLRILTPPARPIPAWTIARTILEASARSAWLLDPDITYMERISRNAALILQDREEHYKVEKMNSERSVENSEEMQEREIIVGRTRKFVNVEISQKGRVTKIGEVDTRVTITSIVKSALNAERDFRLLSALAHQRVTRQRSMAMEITGMRLGITMNELQYVSLLAAPLRWYGTAVWRHFTYCGLDTSWLIKTLEEIRFAIIKDISGEMWDEWSELAKNEVIPPYLISAQIVGMEERFWT